jgi:hypothetical protein
MEYMIRRVIGIALLLAGVALAAEPAKQDNRVGYVFDIPDKSIEWKDAVSGKLEAGQPVYPGQRIIPSTSGGTIVLTYLDGGTLETQHLAFTVRQLGEAKSTGLVAAALAMWGNWSKKQGPVKLMSRGAAFTPAVLKLHDGQLELAPALGSLDSGDYGIELRPFDGGAPMKSTCHVEGSSFVAAVPALQPGMFTLRVTSPDGNFLGSVGVLVAGEQDFEAKNASFQEALQVISRWRRDVSPAVVANFLTLCLTEIDHGRRS